MQPQSIFNNWYKIILEKVQRCAAWYVKGEYTYDASVNQVLNELKRVYP